MSDEIDETEQARAEVERLRAESTNQRYARNGHHRRITITVTTEQAEVVNQAETTLVQLGGIYVRARMLVHVVHDVSESHDLKYPKGQPVISRVGKERLRELCGLAATWQRIRTVRDEERAEASMVPPWVPATLMERGEWKFPALDGISDAPVFRRDGTICELPGYDTATRTIYEPGSTTYPSIPCSPTQLDAAQALDELLEPWIDFAFVALTDRSAMAALVLTMMARAAIDGPTPIFVARAPVPGSGKGLAIDTSAVIATGRPAPKRPPATSEDEFRKAVLAYAIESPALVVLDNVVGSLGSPTLSMLLTAGTINDRLLGANESRTVSVRFVLVATGQNIQFRGDSGRRVVQIDLNPRCEHPEDRTGWRHPDLLAYVHAERPRFVVAALTVLRGFVVAGMPGHGKPLMGSFEAWDRLVRSAIIWAGGDDPLGSVQRIRDEGDEDLERLRGLLVAWHAQFGTRAVTISEAVKHAGGFGELYDAFAEFSEVVVAKELGYAFRRLRGRICGGLSLERVGAEAAGVQWQVQKW